MNIKQTRVEAFLKARGRIAVAFSGGLDSSVLLALAVSVLGADECLAMSAKTPYMMEGELEEASELAAKLGVRHLVVDMPIPVTIRHNPPLRCYECKKALFSKMLDIARLEGFACMVDGTNADDERDYRPGQRALKELGVESPWKDAGLNKAEIRRIGEKLGLDQSITEKPAYACLLTRLEHDQPILLDDLKRINRAETYLRQLGYPAVRVRKHGELARIELDSELIPRLLREKKTTEITSFLKNLGFKYVTLDLEGYRQGNMNIMDA